MQWRRQEFNFGAVAPLLHFPTFPRFPFPSRHSHPMSSPVPPIPSVTFPLPSLIPSLSLLSDRLRNNGRTHVRLFFRLRNVYG